MNTLIFVSFKPSTDVGKVKALLASKYKLSGDRLDKFLAQQQAFRAMPDHKFESLMKLLFDDGVICKITQKESETTSLYLDPEPSPQRLNKKDSVFKDPDWLISTQNFIDRILANFEGIVWYLLVIMTCGILWLLRILITRAIVKALRRYEYDKQNWRVD